MKNENLSDAEVAILSSVRALEPYQVIEIKLNDNKPGEVSMVVTHKDKTIFKR